MSQENLIKLGVSGDLQELSAFGRVFTELWEDGLTREERASDGTLRRDKIANKKNFLLSYDSIDQAPVERLDYLFQINDELVVEITHMATTTQYTVLMSTFGKERALAVLGGLWNGVAVELRQV